MDPTLDEVGLSGLSAGARHSRRSATSRRQSAKRYGYDAWWIGRNVDGPNDEDSRGLHARLARLQLHEHRPEARRAASSRTGTTSYTNALAEAQYQLVRQGRGNVQNVIIFLSDGAANTTPKEAPAPSSAARVIAARPCGSGVKVANQIKGQGTIIYTIGYDVDSDTNGGQCGAEGIDGELTRCKQMASVDDARPSSTTTRSPIPGQLNTIFTQIAADISRPSSRLIPD